MKMNPRGILLIMLGLLTYGILNAASVWNDYKLYSKQIEIGDFIYIIFTEETMIDYEMKRKLDSFQSVQGTEYSGEVFDFFPESQISGEDAVSRDHQWELSVENEAMITTRVDAVNGNVITLSGETLSLIADDLFSVKISGQCDRDVISAQHTVESSYLYNLNFAIGSETYTGDGLISEDNLVFETNYTDISTEWEVVDGITNQVVQTNYSSITVDLTGIDTQTERMMIIQYLNQVVSALFQ